MVLDPTVQSVKMAKASDATSDRAFTYDQKLASLDKAVADLLKAQGVNKRKAIEVKMQECFGVLRDLMLKWLQDKDRTSLREAFEANNFYRLVRLKAILEADKEMDKLMKDENAPDVRHGQCLEAVISVQKVLEDQSGARAIAEAQAAEKARLVAQVQQAKEKDPIVSNPTRKSRLSLTAAGMRNSNNLAVQGAPIGGGLLAVPGADFKKNSFTGSSMVGDPRDHISSAKLQGQCDELDDLLRDQNKDGAAAAAPKKSSANPFPAPAATPVAGTFTAAATPAAATAAAPAPAKAAVSAALPEAVEALPEQMRASWKQAAAVIPTPKAGQAYVPEEDVLASIDADFRAKIEALTSFEDLVKNITAPDAQEKIGNWLIWMCARVYWNDPTLTRVPFMNIYLPAPEKEALIIPRFLDGLAGRNSCVDTLDLSNTNFDSQTAMRFHEVFAKNTTVRIVDLSSNPWNAELMIEWIVGVAASTSLEELRINNMNFGHGGHSQAVEKALAEALEKNTSLVKLGLELKDPNWRNKIDRKIMSNKDLARQKRVAAQKAKAAAAA
ncbi:unnamed protein product [Amoebophrya sp. A25]|nr:unnamed protein product [Amoebophrya sp. A25]|eukprot:GSA25T00004484001.1